MDNEILKEKFWAFAEGNDAARVDATLKMLQILSEKQTESAEICKELDYTASRLVKGLASDRRYARLGFTTALIQVMKAFPQLEVNWYLGKIADLRKICGDDKKEETNLLVGQLLGYMAIIQSDRIILALKEEIELVTHAILQITKKKPLMHLICTQALMQLTEKLPEDKFSGHVWPLLEEKLNCGWVACSPDVLHLLLTVHKHYPTIINKKFLEKHWNCKKLLTRENFEHISNVIIGSTTEHPLIHPMCVELVKQIGESPDKCIHFWNTVMYGKEKVFASGSPRMYLVLQLIPEALKVATTPDEVYAILSPTLIKCLVRSRTHKQHILFNAAKTLLQMLPTIVSDMKGGSLQAAMVIALMSPPSSVFFDDNVKSRVLAMVLTNLSVEGMKELSTVLMKCIEGKIIVRPDVSTPEDIDLLQQQEWAAHAFIPLIKYHSVTEDKNWTCSMLQFLFRKAFFRRKASGADVIMPLSVLTSTFFKCMDNIASSMGKDKHSKRWHSYNEISYTIVQYAQELLQKKDIEPIVQFDGDILISWQEMTATIQKIHKKRKKEGSDMMGKLAFELLFVHHGLQLFSDPDTVMDILKEVHSCYKKASEKRSKTDEEPDWVDVIVDLLIGLLSQQNHFVRIVVNRVFTLLCPLLTRDSLALILDVLQTGSSTEDDLLEVDDEEDEEEEDQEEEMPSGEDQESSSGSESEDEKEAEEVRTKVKTALGKAADDSDVEASSSDLDDEAMEQFDKALAEVFKHKSKKRQVEKATVVAQFKIRCLDLLMILLQETPQSSLLLDLVSPLLHLMQSEDTDNTQRDLCQKAKRLFNMLMKHTKVQCDPVIDIKELPTVIKELMDIPAKAGIGITKELAEGSAFVLQVMHSMEQASDHTTPGKKEKKKGSKTVNKVIDIIKDNLNIYFTRRDCHLSHVFFITMTDKQPMLLWPLADHLFTYCTSKDVRVFCQTQACAMLLPLISKGNVKNLEPEKWKSFAARVVSTVTEILNEHAKDKQAMKPKYLHQLLLLLHRIMTNLDQEELLCLVSQDLVDRVTLFKSMNKDIRKVVNQISNKYRSKPHQQGHKRKKIDDDTPIGDQPSTPAGSQPRLELTKGSTPLELTKGSTPGSSGKKNKKRKVSISKDSIDEMVHTPVDRTLHRSLSDDEFTTPTSSSKKKKKRKKNSDSISKETPTTAKVTPSGQSTLTPPSNGKKDKPKSKDVSSNTVHVTPLSRRNKPAKANDVGSLTNGPSTLQQQLLTTESGNGSRKHRVSDTGCSPNLLTDSAVKAKKKKRKSSNGVL